jgi:hypothetical protein
MKRAAGFILLLLLTNQAGADEGMKAFLAAKDARDAALAKMDAALKSDFEKVVKEVAQTGDLASTQSVANEKEGYFKGATPHSPKMVKLVAAYGKARREEDEKLLKSYDELVKAYTKQLELGKATIVQRSRDAFVKDEGAFLRGESLNGRGSKGHQAVLNFDQDEVRIELEIPDLKKGEDLQIEVLNLKDKLSSSKASIKTTQKLILSTSPEIEVLLEVRKARPGLGILKITPWI